MAALLRDGLEEEGYRVTVAGDGVTALEMARAAQFDVIVLDLMLPRLDGFEVARELRRSGNRTPILMLTARDANTDMVKGLDLGADDYVTKPFSFEVLVARIRAVGRRGPIEQGVQLEAADLIVNTATREVRRGGMAINLTPREFSLLELLLRNKGRVVSRERILEAVWGLGTEVEENTLEAFIKLLRSKVDAPFSTKLIHTVRGVGYSLRDRAEYE